MFIKKILFFFILILFFSKGFCQNKKIISFSEAKRVLKKIYMDNPITIYCGCLFENNKPNLSSCGYISKKNNLRANRIEWEHIVPAQFLGKSFSEWTSGHPKCVKKNGKKFKGRNCAIKMNKQFRKMYVDMYKLYPSIGEINQKRSNFSMGIIEGEKREFGKCDVELDRRIIEPKPDIRGDIARTYIYMDSVYPVKTIISVDHKELFNAWHKADPVDKWECERAKKIEKIQGNRNEVVMKNC